MILNLFHLNCSSDENSFWFYSCPKIPPTEFKDVLLTASFAKTRVQFPDASSWIETGCRISLGNLQINSDFQPKNHLYAKLFLQKTNLEKVFERLGKSAEPGLCFAQTAGIPGKMPIKDYGVFFAKLSF